MAESAAAGNPNAPVQGEGTVQSRANSAISFDDVDKLDDEPRKPERKVVSGAAPTGKAKTARPEKDDEPSKGKKEPDARDKERKADVKASDPKAKAEADGDADEKEDKAQDRPEPKARPRTHKFRSGDTETAVAGDSLVSVTINGKKEDVPLQEIINNYAGKIPYEQKFGELGRREQEHTTRVEALNGKINGFLSKAKENPEDGWDFLAELTGQDPVPLKEQMLRGWISELSEFFGLPEDQREVWIKDRVRDWRDRRYENREKAETEAAERTQKAEAERRYREPYGIDDAAWKDAREIAAKHVNGEPTPEQIAYVNRFHFASEVVKEAVPHLAEHPKRDAIMDDIAQHLLKHPGMTRDQLALVLKESWGKDDESARSLSRKASRNAEAAGEPLSQARTKAKSEPLTFADL